MAKRTTIMTLIAMLGISLLIPGAIYAQTVNENFEEVYVADIIPQDDAVGPIANTGAEYKFDDKFYQMIQDLIQTEHAVSTGSYVFWITASDGTDTEYEPYGVIVS